MIYFYALAKLSVILSAMKCIAWICLMALFCQFKLAAQEVSVLRAESVDLVDRGMWRDAMDHYAEKLLPISDASSGEDFTRTVEALRQLGAWAEFDDLTEQALAAHPDHAGVMIAAARAYRGAPHSGRIIAGEFTRGGGGRLGRRPPGMADDALPAAGQVIATEYRDYVRAMQLLRSALSRASDDEQRLTAWREISTMIQENEAWKLQVLTPLEALPPWDASGPEGATEGAPWDSDGPILYASPASWEQALNDGERWRFALSEQARIAADERAATILARAAFSESQFGAETLAVFRGGFGGDSERAEGVLEMETLGEDECLAKTSDGIRRFKLSPEYHFIALYQSILADRVQGGTAGDALVRIFLDRRQADKARGVLEDLIKRHGVGEGGARKKLLRQIVGNWARFEPAVTVAAGDSPVIPLVYRNASRIRLTAAPVDMDAVLRDAVDYIKSNPAELDWERMQPGLIAQALISSKASGYIGKVSASWQTKLAPRESHRDTRMDLKVPVRDAGAWWITGELDHGNSFHTLVWIVDTVIVEKDVAGAKQWWLADAASGAPVNGAEIEFFGYRIHFGERVKPGESRAEVLTKSLQRTTDDDGKTLLKSSELDPEYQWLAVARGKDRSTAFYGFRPFGIATPDGENQNRDLAYGISDRPIYRPGDTAHLKFFLRNVGYFQPDENKWANRSGKLTLTNGRGEAVMTQERLKTDALGAVEAEFIIPKDAVLGAWNATYQVEGGLAATVALRVEEYRKPEYEVTVIAPSDPVKLGDRFAATIRADYYHGSPVSDAKVEWTVRRSSVTERWFPPGRWDWLYGSGSWWNGVEAAWHPTWERWGCVPPQPPWWRDSRWTPDEVVLRQIDAIGPDGTLRIEIDTAPAKKFHGDLDARYTIEARVVDASRREVSATGSVIAARKRFEVFVWTERAFSRSGDEVEARVSAATLVGKSVVAAKGELKLLKLSLSAVGKVEENEVRSWPIVTDAEGMIRMSFPAPEIGQYRLVAMLSNDGIEFVEGASILNVFGAGSAKADEWKFGPIELVADRVTYSPGETVKLRVNSDQAAAHVWLFPHIVGSSGNEARRIQLDGKSLEIEVPLDLRDMPNMFVEAVTVHGAKVHSTVRQILLPPISQLLDVTVTPAKSKVSPREKSSIHIGVRDSAGKPFQGSVVLSVYDKSLEALAGGSNVGLIHSNFWTWKNQFYGGEYDTLPHSPGNLLRKNSIPMESLGRFAAERTFDDGIGYAAKGGLLESSPMLMDSSMARMSSAAGGDSAKPPGGSPVLLRHDFADLVKWMGTVKTDANGLAVVPLEFPDDLTTWKARIWALGRGTKVGEGSAEILSSKELILRLQTPRFLVERDESVFSAVVENKADIAKIVTISLEWDGDLIEGIDVAPKTLEISPKSQTRVDWRVRALREGELTLRARALAEDVGDAVERTLPIHVHGMLRQDAWSRVIAPDQNSAQIEIAVPEDRRVDQSQLTVRFSPSIAGAVVDAIPYLASYPHAGTEQTLNRFLPAVIARQMLRKLGVNLAEVKGKRTNLNPQEIGDSQMRAAQWQQWKSNPVFDEVELDRMMGEGVEKLGRMQNADGGWGWFSGYREFSYPHMTALVLHGLLLARENSVQVPDSMLKPAIAWLVAYEKIQTNALKLDVEQKNLKAAGKIPKVSSRLTKTSADALDAFVRMVLGEAGLDSESMLNFLHRDRIDLPVYAKCLLGFELNRKREAARRDEVMRMISQFIKRDAENQTCYLELRNEDHWWHWYGSGIEANAWYLKLLSAVNPLDADAQGLAKYIINNRKHASYWDSTRDTAFAVEALVDYFKASQEDAPDMTVEILLDGKSLKTVPIRKDNLFEFDGTVVVNGDALSSGNHTLEIRREGRGVLYANAYLEVFSKEKRLRAAGLEVKISRRVSKLVEVERMGEVPGRVGQIVRQKTAGYRRELLEDGARLKAGERIEVELVLESKNDYEYLRVSDSKGAGFEAVHALSGYLGGIPGAYMEPRAASVDFYLQSLPRGTHTLRYQLRAELLGRYKALPAIAEAVYATELRANSSDQVLEVE